jgi:signal transduction histidine kinase
LSGSIDGHTQLDAQRITQALLVLADNAARHTRVGDDITFGAATVSSAGGDVLRLSGLRRQWLPALLGEHR